MDQKEIDALISQSQGSIAEFSKKQEELIKNLSEKVDTASSTPHHHRKGKVMGQLSRVTEESEAGTNMVMGYMENVLTVISRQQDFIKDIITKYSENPEAIGVIEVLTYLKDNTAAIEELIYSAMDAFQFQDIGRQKLMKVMYTLSKLNEYLNELLGGHEDRGKEFGNAIEKKTLEKDKEKVRVDHIVSDFQGSRSAAAPEDETDDIPAPPAADVEDVDRIITDFQKKENNRDVMDNKDVDDLIAQFQNKNKAG